MTISQLALVGCAHIHTPGFVKRIQARQDVAVKYVWDHQPERAERWAAELNAQVAPDVATILADAAIPAVVICSETNRHEQLVLPAAAAKKHMFVEKPLGFASADAWRMARAIEEAGVLFQTGYFMRGNPAHLFLREQIKAGAFGKITRIRHSNCHAGSIGRWFDTDWRWMTDLDQAGVGAFGDLGTHSLDILMWLMGDIARTTAAMDVALANYGPTDEFGEGLMVFANGVVGTLAAGWVDVADPITVLISGTEGHAYVRSGQVFFKSSHVEGATGEQPWPDLPAMWPHAFELFLDAVIGKEHQPLVTAAEAAARSSAMEAMYKGAATQSWVAPYKP
jgi:predicted dehydrogenase